MQKDDIRSYPYLVKAADVVLKEKNTLNSIDILNLKAFKKEKRGIVYFIVSDNLIIKIGGSSSGLKDALHWYHNMTTRVHLGRVIPNFYIRDELKKGKRVEIYVEYLDLLKRTYRDIETGKYLIKKDVAYYKIREKEWTSLFKENNLCPILNMQENCKKYNEEFPYYQEEWIQKVAEYKE